MIDYSKFFTERVPVIIHGLATNYVNTSAYLTFDDLKRKARYDLFIINRALQRFILTMTVDNINRPSLTVHSRIMWLENQIQSTYQAVSKAKSVSEMAVALTSLDTEFNKVKDDFIELINHHANNQYSVHGYRDITNPKGQFNPFTIPRDLYRSLSNSGEFVNLFVPFDIDDISYIDSHQMLSILKEPLHIHMYGFSDNDSRWSHEYYRYLEQDWARCDIRYNTFDAVYLTFKSAFSSAKPGQYKRAHNYIKPGGTMIIFGMRSDFIPTYLEKLASTLEDIQVRFFNHSSLLDGAPSCKNDMVLIIGRKVSVLNHTSSFNTLLDKFLTGESEFTPYQFSGSTEDVTPFRSYELTENEFITLCPLLKKTEQEAMGFLFPKKEKDTRRPLLPFSSGQLGLVLISGDVNGIVEEQDSGCRHAVKGFSSRSRSSRTETVFNGAGVPTGHKNITVDFPVTNVRVIMPDGSTNRIGGQSS